MAQSYDAIVIGTGQAGPPLAVRLGKAGHKTAIVERKLIGGTCVNVGCIPTKTLIASARAAHVARRAAEFGVVLDAAVRVDMARIKARKDAIVAQSNANVAKWIREAPNVTLIEGQRASKVRAACGSAIACSKRRRSSSTSAAAPPCAASRGSPAYLT